MSQRCKLRIPPSNFDLTCADSVGDVSAASLSVLASMNDLDLELRVLVEYLLYPTVIPTFFWLDFRTFRPVIVKLFVAKIRGSRYEVGCLIG